MSDPKVLPFGARRIICPVCNDIVRDGKNPPTFVTCLECSNKQAAQRDFGDEDPEPAA